MSKRTAGEGFPERDEALPENSHARFRPSQEEGEGAACNVHATSNFKNKQPLLGHPSPEDGSRNFKKAQARDAPDQRREHFIPRACFGL